ncbi:conserved protein of unknown function [Methylacidimicrobium sp. AP8]|uniref:PP2C family protein-serine/threonine phosphatase n=1 Tax=Methylacidimicrobium sp. AP8 TaxID=2730359 RepID=UPI0018C02150|nr:PP2C family serine/threonine-protein phosphatase [Methylacidimicrobium sp. AP8]CAB4243109.1 conserved protein of unknown function [Methylacidimicrobium sp. AP8]
MNLETASLTARGGRAKNEDACGWTAVGGLTAWVVADGLGEQWAGEIASRLAVQSFIFAFWHGPSLAAEDLREYVARADGDLKEWQAEQRTALRMGSTIVAAVSHGRWLRSVHLGDSRFYWFRDNKVLLHSKDHSVPQSLCEAGIIGPEEIRSHPHRDILLLGLGGSQTPEPTVSPEGELRAGDALLLCTDGFWRSLTEADMERELARTAGASEWLGRMETLRRENARSLRDDDNYTAIAVRVGED